ncbi:unnamed protein product [Cylicocyclus nassatus]|uniref:Uncharacterized protein n=1 Tax=Cylicocyclus nassatus TaxID=53992 RepID=A0AA36MAR4_CYLNA|nr:unnamed protein product [Cylicocyclus nassatus]
MAYNYASRPFPEALRKIAGGNVNKFALDLEKEVYANNATELALPVEKRVTTATGCIYKYYMMPVEGKLGCSVGTTPSRRAVFEFDEELND